MKDWVLVLYGTEVHPQDVPTTTTTTTTTPMANRNNKDKRHQKDGQFHGSAHVPAVNNNLGKNHNPQYRDWKPYRNQQYNPYPHRNRDYNEYYNGYHQSHENHTCIFETLAKKNNMSTGEYLRMVRSNLSRNEGKPYWSVACLSLQWWCCFCRCISVQPALVVVLFALVVCFILLSTTITTNSQSLIFLQHCDSTIAGFLVLNEWSDEI